MAILRNGKNTQITAVTFAQAKANAKANAKAEARTEVKAKAKAEGKAKAQAKPTIVYPEVKRCVCSNFRYGQDAWFEEHLRSGKCTKW